MVLQGLPTHPTSHAFDSACITGNILWFISTFCGAADAGPDVVAVIWGQCSGVDRMFGGLSDLAVGGVPVCTRHDPAAAAHAVIGSRTVSGFGHSLDGGIRLVATQPEGIHRQQRDAQPRGVILCACFRWVAIRRPLIWFHLGAGMAGPERIT